MKGAAAAVYYMLIYFGSNEALASRRVRRTYGEGVFDFEIVLHRRHLPERTFGQCAGGNQMCHLLKLGKPDLQVLMEY